MIAEGIDRILKLAAEQIQLAHGRAYAGKELVALPSPKPMAEPLGFHSLRGLVAYVASEFDFGTEYKSVAIVVDGPEGVRLVCGLTGDFRQREVLAEAEPYLAKGFEFGRYLDPETFITQLQACFVQDSETAAILKVVGNIRGEAVQTVADDGVSQTVTARAGIARVAEVDVPNPVMLRPFRTFPELYQPASRYVLRLRQGKNGELPAAALFEVGDCMWKHEAVKSIELTLNELLDKAGVKVDVFA